MSFLLHHAIDKGAEKHPDHEAIRIYNESLTYSELARHSNRLARLLKEQGVRRRDRVGIYLNKCMESAVSIYGIMKAGAAYVPIDPSSPINRVKYVISDCGIRHLISNPGKKKELRSIVDKDSIIECVIGVPSIEGTSSVRCIPWNEFHAEADGNTNLGIRLMEQDLAYIMYTSGSTGDPKGIMHTHHSGLSYAKWAASAYSLCQEDRLTNHAPLHFDLSTFDFFAGALAGATTVIVAEEYMKLPASYSKLLETEKISVFFTVPFALIQILLRGTLDKRNLEHLRWIIFGGEPFPTKYLRQLMKKLPYTQFSNMYGPAEVNGCTFYHVPELSEESEEAIPIGKVCPNIEGIVVDEEDMEVGIGECGELLIRSPTMMQGYWGRPDLNERAYYFRKILEDYQEVFYRTGDLVQVHEDGDYRFLGRKDRQVKIRGYRVELDEVESAIVSHSAVEEAAVFPIEDNEGSNQIQAAVILKADRELNLNSAQLLDHLRDRLPGYACPGHIGIHADFPRTSSGKINRRELQKEAQKQFQLSKEGA